MISSRRTASRTLRDLDELALMGYEIHVESRLCAHEAALPVQVTVTWCDWQRDPLAAPALRPRVVGEFTLSVLPELDFDLCYDLGQHAYAIWVQLYNADLLDDDHLTGRVLLVEKAQVDSEHQGASVAESLLDAVIEHLAPSVDVVLAAPATLEPLDAAALGFAPVARGVMGAWRKASRV